MTVTMQPVKRTALYRTGLTLGATMADHAGWQVAARFRSPDEETQQVQAGVATGGCQLAGQAAKCKGRGFDPAGWQIAGATVWPLGRQRRARDLRAAGYAGNAASAPGPGCARSP